MMIIYFHVFLEIELSEFLMWPFLKLQLGKFFVKVEYKLKYCLQFHLGISHYLISLMFYKNK